MAERCQSLRSLAIPLQAGFDISPFHALKSLVILHADLECISLGGSNGVVGLFLGQLDMLAVHIKGYPEPARWPRQLWTRISLDGFPKLQHVSIFSAGPFSPHSIFHGSAASVQTLVVDGPFEFHYAMQLRAFCRQFRHTKSLSVRNLRLWYNPVFQQVNTLSQLDSLEIVEVDPRYFISDSLKLTQFRMSTAAGLDDLGGVVDMLAPSLQQQKLQTLSLCLPGRLPLDATFVNLIASTNVTLKHLQLIGKKLITYEDRWQLLRNRLIPSLDTAHIQGGWLPAQMQPKALCGIPQAGDDIFHQNRRTPVLECPKELTAEYFNRRFIENADPLGYFAFAWGARSYTLSVGEDENHIRHAMETMPVFEQMGVRLDSPASTLLPPAVTSALPYGVQYDFHDPMELT